MLQRCGGQLEARAEEMGLLAHRAVSNSSVSLIRLFISSQCCTDFFFLCLRQTMARDLKSKTL